MKTILALLLLSSPAFASGTIECKSTDGTVTVNGGFSSAGTWINSVEINGKVYEKGTEFTAEQIYLGDSSFHFLLMDENYNAHILRVETVRREWQSAGMAVLGDGQKAEDTKPIVCELLY